MKEKHFFKVHGEYLTNFLRDLALEPNLSKAIKTIEESFYQLDNKILHEVLGQILRGEKKFIGINDLDLVEDNNENLFPKIFENICYLNDIDERKKELNLYCSYIKTSYVEKSEILLKDTKIEKMSSVEYAWITQGGKLIPVEFQGHRHKVDKIREEELVPKKYPIGENHWIKITTGDSIFSLSEKMTDKQKKTLENYLMNHLERYFKSSDSLELIGYGTAYYNYKTDKITISDYGFKSLDEAKIANPTERVKRISFKRAEDLFEMDCPLFIYEKSEYKRIKNIKNFDLVTKDIYCHISDLYR